MAWHDLTFTASHVLTASDMNRMQQNFAALAQGESGAPAFTVNSLMVTGVASIATLHVSGEATLVGGGLPTGAVIPYAGTAAPAGWLLCAGQAVSRAAYPALFALIGEIFGAGDGGTTFNVPDLRGRTVVALDNLGGVSANAIGATWADSLGGTGGTEVHSLTIAEMPEHSHTLGKSTAHTNSTDRYGRGGASDGNGVTSVEGGGQAHTNVQPSVVLGYIIKS